MTSAKSHQRPYFRHFIWKKLILLYEPYIFDDLPTIFSGPPRAPCQGGISPHAYAGLRLCRIPRDAASRQNPVALRLQPLPNHAVFCQKKYGQHSNVLAIYNLITFADLFQWRAPRLTFRYSSSNRLPSNALRTTRMYFAISSGSTVRRGVVLSGVHSHSR